MDVVGKMVAYEDGDLDEAETLEFFAHLVKTELAWSLQGSYGRTASRLIIANRITATGEVVAR